MPFRKNAKPPEEPKKLLYKKPWWQIWTERVTWVSGRGQKFVWQYIKRWGKNHWNMLYYTTSGNWVAHLHSVRTGYKGKQYLFYADTLKELLEEVEQTKTNHDEVTRLLVIRLQDLIKLKEKEDEGPKPTIRL